MRFAISLASALWPTLIDTNQIETALLNVATNPRDAMPCGGVLLVETANIPSGNEDVPEEIIGRECVLVSMSDTGTGMTPEMVERAFEPFFKTKEVGMATMTLLAANRGEEPHLGMASLLPEHPKGMHRCTYERLQSEVQRAEILADERLGIVLGRLQQIDHRRGGRRGRPVKEFWR